MRLLLLFLLLVTGVSWSDTPTAEIILSTPLSSRINSVGNKVQGVLAGPMTLRNGQQLPGGTTLSGQVLSVESSAIVRHSGRIRIFFTSATLPTQETQGVSLIPDTPDGWLSQADSYLTACKIVPGHSTRLLNTMVRRKLPCDRAVWSQALGINSSGIPDPSTDEFMVQYNRHDILLGAGDWIRLRSAP